MGKDIYDNSAAGAAVYREADSVLGWSVSDVCFNGPEEKLTESKYCQVAIFVTSMACLAAFHEKFGDAVKPVGAAGSASGNTAHSAARIISALRTDSVLSPGVRNSWMQPAGKLTAPWHVCLQKVPLPQT